MIKNMNRNDRHSIYIREFFHRNIFNPLGNVKVGYLLRIRVKFTLNIFFFLKFTLIKICDTYKVRAKTCTYKMEWIIDDFHFTRHVYRPHMHINYIFWLKIMCGMYDAWEEGWSENFNKRKWKWQANFLPLLLVRWIFNKLSFTSNAVTESMKIFSGF